MKQLLVFLSIFLCVLVSSVYGVVGNKTIQVIYKNIAVYVNKKLAMSDVEPFIYNNKTFVPLRMVAEALDKDVKWDPKKNRIDIDDKQTGAIGTDTTIVYITDTGDKYHRYDCRYLDESKMTISLKYAKYKGYGACGVCDPPK